MVRGQLVPLPRVSPNTSGGPCRAWSLGCGVLSASDAEAAVNPTGRWGPAPARLPQRRVCALGGSRRDSCQDRTRVQGCSHFIKSWRREGVLQVEGAWRAVLLATLGGTETHRGRECHRHLGAHSLIEGLAGGQRRPQGVQSSWLP